MPYEDGWGYKAMGHVDRYQAASGGTVVDVAALIRVLSFNVTAVQSLYFIVLNESPDTSLLLHKE